MLKKAGHTLFIFIIVVLVSTPLVTYWREKPTLAVTIRTWSMTPLMTRGDMVFIWPTGEKTVFSEGNIIVFRSEKDGIRDWTMHRIVGGDSEQGFITRGDANEWTDQEGLGYPPVRPEWIAGVVPTVGPLPLKIPLLGYIPLLIEGNIKNPLLLPALLGILAAALVLDEIFKPKKKRRKEVWQKGQLYILAGLAFAILIGSLMLMGSLFLTFSYGVEKNAGVLMGSDVGILELGDSREQVLAELENEGAIPLYYYAVSRDPQVVLHQDWFYLSGGHSAQVMATVHGQKEGLYQANVKVGMFMPFLPPGIIRSLAVINFWLALVVVSLVPALPLFVLPYLEPRYRRRFVREVRKKGRGVCRYLPI